MLKVSENPPILLPGVESVRELPGKWQVAHTKSRAEKVFAWELLRREIGYFLPLQEKVRVSGGRKRRVFTPLFPGYVFFCGTPDDRYTALVTHRLCQVIDVVDQSTLIRQLEAIANALASDHPLENYPHTAVGRRCRITAGAMAGTEGTVIQGGHRSRIVLQITILGQGVVMEVEASLLEPAE